jgi:hypothetical protein
VRAAPSLTQDSCETAKLETFEALAALTSTQSTDCFSGCPVDLVWTYLSAWSTAIWAIWLASCRIVCVLLRASAWSQLALC